VHECDRRQTDRPRYGEISSYRRYRMRCKKRFRLVITSRHSCHYYFLV